MDTSSTSLTLGMKGTPAYMFYARALYPYKDVVHARTTLLSTHTFTHTRTSLKTPASQPYTQARTTFHVHVRSNTCAKYAYLYAHMALHASTNPTHKHDRHAHATPAHTHHASARAAPRIAHAYAAVRFCETASHISARAEVSCRKYHALMTKSFRKSRNACLPRDIK